MLDRRSIACEAVNGSIAHRDPVPAAVLRCLAALLGQRSAVAFRRFLHGIWVVAAALACDAAASQPPPVGDEVCIGCHAVPSTKFHSQPSHKKLTCAQCHVGGAEHVADTRARPKLGGERELCASCHEAKKKHGG